MFSFTEFLRTSQIFLEDLSPDSVSAMETGKRYLFILCFNLTGPIVRYIVIHIPPRFFSRTGHSI